MRLNMKIAVTAKPKLTPTRIVEIVLLTFILAFVARATPNLDVLPNIPWAEDRTNGDLANTDDKRLGELRADEIFGNAPTRGHADVEASTSMGATNFYGSPAA
jgi:hypothetical protein